MLEPRVCEGLEALCGGKPPRSMICVGCVWKPCGVSGTTPSNRSEPESFSESHARGSTMKPEVFCFLSGGDMSFVGCCVLKNDILRCGAVGRYERRRRRIVSFREWCFVARRRVVVVREPQIAYVYVYKTRNAIRSRDQNNRVSPQPFATLQRTPEKENLSSQDRTASYTPLSNYKTLSLLIQVSAKDRKQ